VSGSFIGSDYNFIYSSNLRKIILDNCLEENKSVYMKFQDYKNIDYRIQRLLANNGLDSESGNRNIDEDDTNIHQIVYQNF
jgi:hypothetical protein